MMPTSASSNSLGSDPGFTLVEMLVVLAILSLVAGLAGSFLSRKPGLSAARTDLGELRVVARQISAQARTTGKVQYLTAEDGVVRWKTAHGVERTVDAMINPLLPSERPGAIAFYPDGSSSGGRVTVAGRTDIILGINWLTGSTEVAGGAN